MQSLLFIQPENPQTDEAAAPRPQAEILLGMLVDPASGRSHSVTMTACRQRVCIRPEINTALLEVVLGAIGPIFPLQVNDSLVTQEVSGETRIYNFY